MNRSFQELAACIDHTLLAPGILITDLRRHCREAVKNRFHAVCLLPAALPEARKLLRGSEVRLCSVVAFPHGGSTPRGKVFEALECREMGAVELDIVADLSAIRNGDYRRFSREIRMILEKTPECLHKIILEVGLLTDTEVERAIRELNDLGPAFLKTSTGTLGRPVTPVRVERIRSLLREDIGLKAAGGIRTLQQVIDFLAAGANRIGTSAGMAIFAELQAREKTAEGPSHRVI